MRKLILLFTLVFATSVISAQVHKLDATAYKPMSTTKMNSLTPTEGYTIYNTTTKTIWSYDGSTWVEGGGSGSNDASDLTTGTLNDDRLSSAVSTSLGKADTALQTESDPLYSAWDKDYDDLINKPLIVGDKVSLDDATANTLELSIKDGDPATDYKLEFDTIGSDWGSVPSGGSANWGDIGGTLLNQTDLSTALNNKLGLSGVNNITSAFFGVSSTGNIKFIDANSSTSLVLDNNKISLTGSNDSSTVVVNLSISEDEIRTTLTNAQITATGAQSLITKGYADANYSGGGSGITEESGNFTADLIDLNGGATYSTTKSLVYYRIGNMVTINAFFTSISVTGTPTGNLQISNIAGLPSFTSAYLPIFNIQITSNTTPFTSIQAAGVNSIPNKIIIYRSTDTTPTTNSLQFPAPTAIGSIRITGTYLTN